MSQRKFLPVALLLVFLIETLSVTWCLKIPRSTPFFTVTYFLSGIAFACLLLKFPAIKLPKVTKRDWLSHANHYRLVITAMLGLMLYSWCLYWFDESPIDITNADMLPIIKVMGERFIAGQHSHIYDVIPWIWHGTQPIYLPAMWLPYVPAIFLHMDMRWITMAGLLFAFGTFVFIYRPERHRYLSFFMGALAFLLFWWIVADNTAGIVSVAEEGTVIAYYVLLVLALLSGRPWLIAVAISLCMLSRYALVGWLPAYILFLAMDRRWKQLGIITLTGLLCFVLLFLVPVGWSTFLRLASLPGDYVAFAGRVWKDSPDVFSSAPGFAWFFGPHHIAQLHKCLIILTFIVPSAFVFGCYRNREKIEKANLPVAALKLGLVVFYCFIDVPYLYLFYTSSMVSLVLIALALRMRTEELAPPAAQPAA